MLRLDSGLMILKLPTDGAARQDAKSPPNLGTSRTAIGCSSALTLGYVWEISQPISDMPTDEALASTQDSWYGDSSTS